MVLILRDRRGEFVRCEIVILVSATSFRLRWEHRVNTEEVGGLGRHSFGGKSDARVESLENAVLRIWD